MGGQSHPPLLYTSHTNHTPIMLLQRQQTKVQLLEKLITDKYEELIWNECYYDGDNQQIKDILGDLQSEGIEFTFSVKLKSYDVETGEDLD